MKKLLQALQASALLLVLVLIFIFRQSAAQGVYLAISYSLSVLIPSILPFMFVSSLFSVSAASLPLCKILSPVTRHLFRLNPCAAPVILFGMTCGYPVGAKLSAELLDRKEISQEEASRLLLFTLNPGIPFCVLFLGGTVLGSLSAGWLLYLSISCGGIVSGIFLGLLSKNTGGFLLQSEKQDPMWLSVKKAADSTVRACLQMVFFIVIFWSGLSIFRESGGFAFLVRQLPLPFLGSLEKAGILSFLFEVTRGISDSASLGLPLYIFLLGLTFGGLCIHLQLFSFFKNPPVKYPRFFLWRTIHCALTLGFYRLFQLLLPQGEREAVSVSASFYSPVLGGLKGNFVGSFCLVILFVTYLFVSQKETVAPTRKK
jgi:hypothetical protein